MAHKTRVSGTNYEITGGKVKVSGTNYEITSGKVKVSGTNYDILFFTGFYIEGEKFLMDDGMTWYDWVDSDYFRVPIGFDSMYIDNFGSVILISGDYTYRVFRPSGEGMDASEEIQRGRDYPVYTEE